MVKYDLLDNIFECGVAQNYFLVNLRMICAFFSCNKVLSTTLYKVSIYYLVSVRQTVTLPKMHK